MNPVPTVLGFTLVPTLYNQQLRSVQQTGISTQDPCHYISYVVSISRDLRVFRQLMARVRFPVVTLRHHWVQTKPTVQIRRQNVKRNSSQPRLRSRTVSRSCLSSAFMAWHLDTQETPASLRGSVQGCHVLLLEVARLERHCQR
jgi:hypothetical protein